MPLRYVSRETIESELSKAITYITFNPDPELPALLESALAIEICDISKDILHCMLDPRCAQAGQARARGAASCG